MTTIFKNENGGEFEIYDAAEHYQRMEIAASFMNCFDHIGVEIERNGLPVVIDAENGIDIVAVNHMTKEFYAKLKELDNRYLIKPPTIELVRYSASQLIASAHFMRCAHAPCFERDLLGSFDLRGIMAAESIFAVLLYAEQAHKYLRGPEMEENQEAVFRPMLVTGCTIDVDFVRGNLNNWTAKQEQELQAWLVASAEFQPIMRPPTFVTK